VSLGPIPAAQTASAAAIQGEVRVAGLHFQAPNGEQPPITAAFPVTVTDCLEEPSHQLDRPRGDIDDNASHRGG
jgi:hypothetical protein